MKKIIISFLATFASQAALVTSIKLTPYLTGTVAAAAETGGKIPHNFWQAIAFNSGSIVLLLLATASYFWFGSCIADWQFERRKK